jgi:predicted Zn-dependent peptidase
MPSEPEFRHATLSNGLTLIGEVDPRAASSAAGFFVRTGARDEARPLMGVSHFLEHMMFKGTDDLAADELNRRFDEIGANNNAYTSGEMTCFYAHVLPERVGEASDLLARMLRPALRQDDFDREKEVILEEIAMYKDEPFSVLYDETLERHFGNHPMGHRVLGTQESVRAMVRDQMAGYFNERYSADNTIVSLAGRVDFDALADRIDRLCAAWRPTRVSRDSSRPRPAGGNVSLTDAKITRAYLLGLAEAPSYADPSRYAAMLLAQVLGASDNSRLHWALVEPGLAEEAQAGYDPHDGTGQFHVFASCDPARADEVWSKLLHEIRGLRDSLVPDDLERLRSKLLLGVTLGGERPADRMQRLGRQWTYQRAYTTLQEELDRINAVTIADLRGVADAWPLAPITTGRLVPAKATG